MKKITGIQKYIDFHKKHCSVCMLWKYLMHKWHLVNDLSVAIFSIKWGVYIWAMLGRYAANHQTIQLHFLFTYIRSNGSYVMAKSVGPASQPAVYQTFNTNHLSYTKTLVSIYRFRAIIISSLCRYFFEKNCIFIKNILKKLCLELFFKKPSL